VATSNHIWVRARTMDRLVGRGDIRRWCCGGRTAAASSVGGIGSVGAMVVRWPPPSSWVDLSAARARVPTVSNVVLGWTRTIPSIRIPYPYPISVSVSVSIPAAAVVSRGAQSVTDIPVPFFAAALLVRVTLAMARSPVLLALVVGLIACPTAVLASAEKGLTAQLLSNAAGKAAHLKCGWRRSKARKAVNCAG
jgi:hypothetical protein